MASVTRPFLASSNVTAIPLFLAPAFARTCPASTSTTAQFSTTAHQSRASATRKQAGLKAKTQGKPNWSLQHRPKIDRNKQRGVSAIHRTGPRSTRGLWKYPLPVPVARDHRTTEPEYADAHNHGLWEFFDESRQAMLEPSQVSSHGRSWEYQELTVKSFEDLHTLYWVCVKEKNRCLTQEKERVRLRAGYGVSEHEERLEVVTKTMRRIREVLINRQLSFNQANVLITQHESLADIFEESEASALEDERAAPTQDDVFQPTAGATTAGASVA